MCAGSLSACQNSVRTAIGRPTCICADPLLTPMRPLVKVAPKQARDPRSTFVRPRMSNPTRDAPRAIDAHTKLRADVGSPCRQPGLPASAR